MRPALFIHLLALQLTAAHLFAATVEGAAESRYFLMGSGDLRLHNLRNGRSAELHLQNADGTINEEGLRTADYIFGFPAGEKNEHISPRMLFMLSHFADRVAPGKTIEIESAYRSPEYNDKIRKQGANAARTSTHIDGMALDFRIEGVDGKSLWEMVRAENCCGVGHYGGASIHLDAGRPRFWEAATSGTGSPVPDHNRHIYLSTLYDRYRPGESLTLSFSSISVFDFGVHPVVRLVPVAPAGSASVALPLHTSAATECLHIGDRATSRFLETSLPESLVAGRYTVELEFCQRPFPEMPEKVTTREIEIFR